MPKNESEFKSQLVAAVVFFLLVFPKNNDQHDESGEHMHHMRHGDDVKERGCDIAFFSGKVKSWINQLREALQLKKYKSKSERKCYGEP